MRIVILDANPQTRERMKAIFGLSREFEVLAICPNTRSAFVMADSLGRCHVSESSLAELRREILLAWEEELIDLAGPRRDSMLH